MTRILLINGPNLNLLGTREPETYGYETLADCEAMARRAADDAGAAIDCRQSNHECEIVTWIQEARETTEAIVINAGAYTHTSVAIQDALRAYPGFIVELHVSNPHLREAFRHRSFISGPAHAVVAGFGVAAYPRVVKAVAARLSPR